MRGNSFGKLFSLTSFGESHGKALGVVLDGVPSNLSFSKEDLQKELDRRAPGNLPGTTSRVELDQAEVLSGIFEGKTLGTPIAIIVKNQNQRSSDYTPLKNEYRPGHADKTTMLKYGIRDHRGGGRSSGRETLSRVIAGYFAGLIIPSVKVRSFINKLGPFETEKNPKELIYSEDPYILSFGEKREAVINFLNNLKKNGESVGGRVSILIDDCPPGLGEPAFDKLKADLAKSLFSIGAVTSVSLGKGYEMADLPGSEISSDPSNFGGIEGGIANGERIFLEVTFKPTSTIGEKAKEGRHDPCIVPRALPVVEAMVKIVLADHFLRQRAYEGI
jgi:chorismate synthase